MTKWFFRLMTIAVIGFSISSQPAAADGTGQETAQLTPLSDSTEINELLARASQQFQKQGTVEQETANGLLEHEQEVVPIVITQLGRLKDDPTRIEGDPSSEPRFWLDMVKVLRWNGRLLPALQQWLQADDFPLEAYDDYDYVQAMAYYVKSQGDRVVVDPMDEASVRGMSIILKTLKATDNLNDAQLQDIVDRYRMKPQFEGIIDYFVSQQDVPWLMKLYDTYDLSDVQKRKVALAVNNSYSSTVDTTPWLRSTAAQTQDISVEQEIDMNLVLNHGDEQAKTRLIQSGEANGYVSRIDGRVEKILDETYPSSTLSQGINDYQSIRGAYFHTDDDPWYSSDGNDFQHPKQAIAEWLDYISKYPNHPAVDDAAYRLARCYEMTGQYKEALYWFDRSRQMGDRDMAYKADGMMRFVLDADMTSADFEQSSHANLPDWMTPWLDYSYAVALAREQQYEQAADQLKQFIEKYKGQDIISSAHSESDDNWWYYSTEAYPFWGNLQIQQQQFEALADKQRLANNSTGIDQAENKYALAAFIYKQPLIFYNYLWQEQRQTFFWIGGIRAMGYNPTLTRYVQSFNQLLQAQEVFKGIDLSAASADIGAKTLFTLALTQSKLIDYGDEISYVATKAQLAKRLIEYAEQLVDTYPQSDLADDALMLMYNYTKDESYLNEIISSYPDGDQFDKASAYKQHPDNPSQTPNRYAFDPLTTFIRYQTLNPKSDNLPDSIKEWIGSQQSGPYAGMKEEGDWVYVYCSGGSSESIPYLIPESTPAGVTIQCETYSSLKSHHDGEARSSELLIRIPKFLMGTDTVHMESTSMK